MTVSFHKYGNNFFPGTGDLEEVGVREGKYYSVNVPLRDGIDDRSYLNIFKPIIQVQCIFILVYNSLCIRPLWIGIDPLQWCCNVVLILYVMTDLGASTYHLRAMLNASSMYQPDNFLRLTDPRFVKSFNLPTLVVGGGGYTVRNVARCWTYETSVLLDTEVSNDLPFNDYFEYFSPDFQLIPEALPLKYDNLNSKQSLDNLKV